MYSPLRLSKSLQPIANISDLRDSTAFTYVETASSTEMSGCSTDPATLTEWRTAYVNGIAYPGETVVATITGPTSFIYTFPQLIVSLLAPGDVITQVNPLYTMVLIVVRNIHTESRPRNPV